MFDSFPYDSLERRAVGDFWTWGGHNSTGTYVLTVARLRLVVCALVGWVLRERRALERHAAELRESELFGAPQP